MKKIVSAILAASVLLSVCLMTGCSNGPKLKFGMGIYSSYSQSSSAQGETPGSVDSDHTVAVVTLSEDGKIVECVSDPAVWELMYFGHACADEEYRAKNKEA